MSFKMYCFYVVRNFIKGDDLEKNQSKAMISRENKKLLWKNVVSEKCNFLYDTTVNDCVKKLV